MLQDRESNESDRKGRADSGKSAELEATFLDSLNALNETDAWDLFFEEYYPLVLKYAGKNGMKGEDREEIGSRVISRMFQHVSRNKFKINGSLRSYLAIVVKHEVIDYFNETNRFYGNGSAILSPLAKNLFQQDGEKYDEFGELIDLEVKHKLQILEKAMCVVRNRVAKRSWQMFCDVTIEGIRAKEVAEKFGVKTQTVYQRNFQILRMINEKCKFD